MSFNQWVNKVNQIKKLNRKIKPAQSTSVSCAELVKACMCFKWLFEQDNKQDAAVFSLLHHLRFCTV
jgi:hypothetical protein